MVRGRPPGSKNKCSSKGHGGDRRSKAFQESRAKKRASFYTPYRSKKAKLSPSNVAHPLSESSLRNSKEMLMKVMNLPS